MQMQRMSYRSTDIITHLLAAGTFAAMIGAAPQVAAQQSADAPAAVAENEGVRVTDDGNRVIYGSEYFSQYNVITANDQLQRIPGIQDLLGGGGGGERGFGSSGDQILINGRRISGKSNDADSVLERIQARQVLRVEVIRGTVPDLDVRSQGRVVNVVLDEALTTGYGSWQANVDSYSGGRMGGGSELSYNGDLGALSYLFSLEGDLRKNSSEQSERFFTADNRLFERNEETTRDEQDDYGLSTNTTYTFSNGDILNLNGLYEYEDETESETSSRFSVTGSEDVFERDVLIDDQGTSRSWEIGGDYEHILANGNALNLLFLYTSESSEDQSSFASRPPGGDAVVENLQRENSDSTEEILRSTYQWNLGTAHSFESGGEMAVNTVEEQSQLFENVDGELQETSLFNQQSTIEETRYEAFTTYTWQAMSDLLVEGSLDLEYSEIEQQGNDVNRKRDFFFTRPRLVVRYDRNARTQWRARLERSVDQLDFGSFVSSFTDDNNRFDVISAGNPELVPEKSWDLELTWERRLADDMGIVTLTGQYSDVEDRRGRIPLTVQTQDGETVERTAPGNIGDGHSWDVELSGSLRLGWWGLRNAVIDASVAVEDSSVTDPFTGREREFDWTSDYEWSLGFRHDTSWNNFSYGLETGNQAPASQFDRDYRQTVDRDPDLELFGEIQPIRDLTFRLSVESLLRSEGTRERLQFPGNRGDTSLQRREFRIQKPDRQISFSVQGVF